MPRGVRRSDLSARRSGACAAGPPLAARAAAERTSPPARAAVRHAVSPSWPVLHTDHLRTAFLQGYVMAEPPGHPAKKGAHLAVCTAPMVSPPFPTTPRSHRWSYACALTRSVSGIAWARPDQGSRSATRRASWAHCRSCMRRNTRQPREQDVRHASTKRRFAQARSASFDIFAVDCGAKR